jgi:hypothetical protein
MTLLKNPPRALKTIVLPLRIRTARHALIKTTLLALLAGALLAGCDSRPKPETNAVPTAVSSLPATPATPTAEQWQRVAQMRVLFAHQSVGGNIVEGIRRAAEAKGMPIAIEESRTALPGAGIQHFKVGHNENPEGKLVDFKAVFDAETTPPDIALLKFCYIDFTDAVDPQQLAQHYIATLDGLARAHPGTRFVPMTSPLTTVQTGPRAWVKRLLGKAPGGYAANARREVFNTAIRGHYASGGLLFDIAALESGNGRHHVDANGTRVETLDPALAADEGHLNASGRQLLGEALVTHLATVEELKAAGSAPAASDAPAATDGK